MNVPLCRYHICGCECCSLKMASVKQQNLGKKIFSSSLWSYQNGSGISQGAHSDLAFRHSFRLENLALASIMWENWFRRRKKTEDPDWHWILVQPEAEGNHMPPLNHLTYTGDLAYNTHPLNSAIRITPLGLLLTHCYISSCPKHVMPEMVNHNILLA